MKVRHQNGFTLIELLIVVAIIGILAAVAIPGLLRARMSGNEASAIGSMHAVGSSEASYAAGASQGGYAVSLARLVTACPGGTQGFISTDLAVDPSLKSGYTITLAAGAGSTVLAALDCNGQVSRTGFYATAVPLLSGTSGGRAFATDNGGAVWQNLAATAPPQPFTKAGTIAPIQ
jgi:prepilin-type N-terminal cleavage/methylation domain-containing protein